MARVPTSGGQDSWESLTVYQQKKLQVYKESILKVLSKMQALAEDEDEFILYITSDIDSRLDEIPDQEQ